MMGAGIVHGWFALRDSFFPAACVIDRFHEMISSARLLF
jgi:hypothetical protein